MKKTAPLFLAFLLLCFAALAPAQVTTSRSSTSNLSNVTGTLSPANGGTGVANNAAATTTRSGNHGVTLTTTGTTALTLPTSGTVTTSTACTWTPVDASGAALTFTGVVSTCDRDGNMVYVRAQLTYPAQANGSDAKIGGLPTPVPNSAAARGTCVINSNAATVSAFLLDAATSNGTIYTTTITAKSNGNMTGAVVWVSCAYPAT